jgi:trk system potassium uptake protein TrkH
MPVKVDKKPVTEEAIESVMSYFIIFVFLFLSGALLFCIIEDCDIETALSAAIACLSNVGPGLAKVGPMTNYGWVSIPGKLLLCFLMLAGRLEVYAILILFSPYTWKK